MAGLRVAVVGGGLGGLCLAQGLLTRGVDVTVFERDPTLAARGQGYRLHLDARGGLALRECLPHRLFALVMATAGQPSRGFTVVDKRLRVKHRVTADPGTDPDAPETLSTSVNRQTLREILYGGLGDRVRFGHAVTDFDPDGDGVTVQCADRGDVRADVLVGADGVTSVVRRQLLPHARVTDSGARCIYGRTPLDGATDRLLPAPLRDGFMAAIGGRVGVAAGLMQFRHRPELTAAEIAPDVALSPAVDYLMWAVSAQREQFPLPDAAMRELGAAALHRIARQLTRTFHPDLRSLIGCADVAETFFVRVRSAEPVPAWPAGRVTVLGDAIHAMSPARGSGANTALRDAAALCRALTAHGSAGPGIVAAIAQYEAAMRVYGFAAVKASREAETMNAARGNGVLVRLARYLPVPGRPG